MAIIPAFPPPSTPILVNLRRSTAAALAAIALTTTIPPIPPPLTPSFPVAHAKIACTTPPPPSVLFDKHFIPPPLHPTDTTPAPPRRSNAPQISLPPSPSLSTEVRILARLLVALVVGGIIGVERRAANSLAGVRTFSLVSLGAAIFMTTTLVAFPSADPTRVAAAISSSVGFLGAGAMQKTRRQSRGLTTASSVWLAAALGIAAASGMFLLAFTGSLSTVLIARYARFDSSLHLIRRRHAIAPFEDGFDAPPGLSSPTHPAMRFTMEDDQDSHYSLIDLDPSSRKADAALWRKSDERQ